jgi:hypothetical protein
MLLMAGCAAPRTQQAAVDPQRRAQEVALQKRMVLERQTRDQARIEGVAWPILAGAAPLCAKTAPRLGMWYATTSTYGKEYGEAAREVLHVTDRVTVVSVSPGSPADRAGMKVGDSIVSVNGTAIPPGAKAIDKLQKVMSAQIAPEKDTTLVILRDDIEQSVQLRPEVVCNYPVELGSGDDINAFADGQRIVIQKGMLRFAETDAELATVIGHELAHNAMGHIDAQKTNAMLGSILDIAVAAAGVNTGGAFSNAAAKAYSQEFEAEADYVGLYALALAHLSIDESANLWRRMAAEAGASVKTQYSSTHPGSADRYLALENAALEIHTKADAGEELRPNLKKPTKQKKQSQTRKHTAS